MYFAELSSHLANTAVDYLNRSEFRLWERSLPLWCAGFYVNKGIPLVQFSGNHGTRVSTPKKLCPKFDALPCELQRDIVLLRDLAGKQKSHAHADFTIFGAQSPFSAEVMLEIKSGAGYRRSTLPIKAVESDIIISMTHSLIEGESCSSATFFLNINEFGQPYMPSWALEQKLRSRFASTPSFESDDAAKLWKAWKSLIWIIQPDGASGHMGRAD